jgi:3-oxoacyl-[acyl-carrier-protein] synthase III
VLPYLRGVGAEDRSGVRTSYVESYARNFDAIRRRFGVTPRRLVCNQVGTRVVAMLPEVAGVAPEDTVVSGHDHGHLGGGDVIVGLQRLAESDRLDAPILVGGSAAFAFGAGLIVPGT